MAAVNLVHGELLEEETEGQGRRQNLKQSRPLPERDLSPLGTSNSTANESRHSNPVSNLSRRATSEPDKAKTEGEQIKAAEVVYYTARLKEYYDRSDTDIASTVASGQERKYLDQLKGQLKIGKKEPSKAVVPYDPTGIKKYLKPLGKEDLMELVVNMAKKLEEAGKSTEIQRLLDIALSAPAVKPTRKGDLTGIDKLLKDGLLAFLVKIRQHVPRFPPQVVKFKGVTYGAQLRGAKQGFDTVGSTVLKCLFACCAERQAVQQFNVLNNCSGYLMPGTLTLVCGPPGCGKSSLHKALGGRLYLDKTTILQGSVTYNQNPLDKIQVRRLAAFIAQTDRHLPTLTVRETCEFANACTSHFANNPEWFSNTAMKRFVELVEGNAIE